MPYYNKCWKTEFQPMKMENANLKYVKPLLHLNIHTENILCTHLKKDKAKIQDSEPELFIGIGRI